MSIKQFLAEDQDTHDEVIVVGPSEAHQVEELERDLLTVRHHYHELGQRASALASERDAVAARLNAAQADAESARRQLEALQAHHQALAAGLEARLESRQAELTDERRQRQHLESELAQTDKRIKTLLDRHEQEQQARDSQLVAQLDDLTRQLTATREERTRLKAEQQSLASELERAREASTAEREHAREQSGALEQSIAEVAAEHGKALEYARALEASLTAAAEQQQNTGARLAALEQERNTLASELDQAQKTSAAERDGAREQIGALEKHIGELEAEHTASLQQARELETSLTAAAERQRNAEQRVRELEQTLQEQTGALEAELGTTREALTRARTEQQQTRDEQARLTDSLCKVEQQLAETERLNQEAREEAAKRVAVAEKAQRALGEKVRQLAEQLHQQHQQQDRLEQQARSHRKQEAKLRAESERKSSELQAELYGLQEELERRRSAASSGPQDQADEPDSPRDDAPGRPTSWKMVAGVSLLVGTVASATAYWNAPKDSQHGLSAETGVRSPSRHSIATAVADVLQTSALDPSAPLPLPGSSAPQLLFRDDADGQGIAAASYAGVSRRSEDPVTTTAPSREHEQAGATGARAGSSAEMSETLQSTARDSLRALNDELAGNHLGLSGDASIQAQQNNLIALGFDLGESHADGVKGKRTRQALSEFQQYYLPATGLQDVRDEQHLAAIMNLFADIARNDQQAFDIDREVLAAIRLGSLRTGMDFPYLMELAYTESTFNPAKKARRSSARGLYQFTDATWLYSIKAYGEKYGLGLYASQIEYSTDHRGRRRPSVGNPIVYRHILALRYDPRIATLMAAEFTLQNKRQLTRFLGTEFGRTELYLTHFFGIEAALRFLRLLKESPDRDATELFPKAAQSNPGVFAPWEGETRTMQEVYDFFDAKFDTGRYETLNPGLALVETIWQ